MPVPLLDVNAQNLPLEQELQAAFQQVLRHGRFIMGPEMEAFEREVAAMVGVKHALAVSSGTDALLLALMALNIKPGDEVLCPAFTFFATAGAVSALSSVPTRSSTSWPRRTSSPRGRTRAPHSTCSSRRARSKRTSSLPRRWRPP